MVDKTDFIGAVTGKLQALADQGLPLRDDFEKNVRAILTSAFSKMDLLTREEFEAQAAVLQRTRMMVEELEKRVAALENPKKTEHTPAVAVDSESNEGDAQRPE